MERPRSDDVLAAIALERATTLAPFVFVAVLLALVVSEPVGVALSGPVIAWNIVALTALAVGSIALRRRRIPESWGHITLALVWAIPVVGTLLSGAYTDMSQLMPVSLVEMLSTVILLRTDLVIAALIALDLAWLPHALTGDGATAMLMWSMLAAQSFAVLFNLLHRSALVRAERHRIQQEATARELACQLAELRRSEDERGRLHDQLLHAQRMEATGTLAAGLAHDMNNVLASITSFAELVRGSVSDAVAARDLDHIVAQAGRGAELTRGLLAFGRRGQYRKQVVGVDSIFAEVAPILSRTLPKSIELRMRPGAADVCIEGDATQLHQVLINLALNAADAMSGTGTLELESSCVDLPHAELARRGLVPGRYVTLRVRDTGCGMDEATRRRAFEPFFTTKPRGKGTGLGLSTVWGILQNHGGTVEIESTIGQGSTFTLYLPTTAERPVAAPPVATPAPQAHQTTVLVVDDEEAVRSATARLLQRRGHEVLTAANGEEGLRVYREHHAAIGLVILDMGMPVMNGAQCFRELRTLGSVPVLIATGYADDADAQALTADGAVLLEKPFPPARLLDEVTRQLAPARCAA